MKRNQMPECLYGDVNHYSKCLGVVAQNRTISTSIGLLALGTAFFFFRFTVLLPRESPAPWAGPFSFVDLTKMFFQWPLLADSGPSAWG
jgi:hypothetical protein